MIPTIQPSYDHYEEKSSYKVYLEKHSRAVQWLTILLFLTLTSFLFACLFEWDRYQVIAGPRAQTMSMSDKVLLFLASCVQINCVVSPVSDRLGNINCERTVASRCRNPESTLDSHILLHGFRSCFS